MQERMPLLEIHLQEFIAEIDKLNIFLSNTKINFSLFSTVQKLQVINKINDLIISLSKKDFPPEIKENIKYRITELLIKHDFILELFPKNDLNLFLSDLAFPTLCSFYELLLSHRKKPQEIYSCFSNPEEFIKAGFVITIALLVEMVESDMKKSDLSVERCENVMKSFNSLFDHVVNLIEVYGTEEGKNKYNSYLNRIKLFIYRYLDKINLIEDDTRIPYTVELSYGDTEKPIVVAAKLLQLLALAACNIDVVAYTTYTATKNLNQEVIEEGVGNLKMTKVVKHLATNCRGSKLGFSRSKILDFIIPANLYFLLLPMMIKDYDYSNLQKVAIKLPKTGNILFQEPNNFAPTLAALIDDMLKLLPVYMANLQVDLECQGGKLTLYQASLTRYLQILALSMMDYATMRGSSLPRSYMFKDIISKLIIKDKGELDKKLIDYLVANLWFAERFVINVQACWSALKSSDIVTLENQLKVLDEHIENIYQEIGFVSANYLKWLADNKQANVSITAGRGLVTIETEDSDVAIIIYDILSARSIPAMVDIFNDKAVILPHFRKNTDISKFNFEKAYFKKVKALYSKRMKANKGEVSGNDGEVIFLDTPEIKVKVKKEKSTKSKNELQSDVIAKKIVEKREDRALLKSIKKNLTMTSLEVEEVPSQIKAADESMFDDLPPLVEYTDQDLEFISNNAVAMPIVIASEFSIDNAHSQNLPVEAYNALLCISDILQAKNHVTLETRYLALYNLIICSQQLVDVLACNISQDSTTFKAVVCLRNIFADNIHVFLDPEGCNENFLSSQSDSLLANTIGLFKYITKILSLQPAEYDIDQLRNNHFYKKYTQDDVFIMSPSNKSGKQLLNAMKNKIKYRLKHFLSMKENEEKANVIKMFICEVGNMARLLRDNLNKFSRDVLGSHLTTGAYSKELCGALSFYGIQKVDEGILMQLMSLKEDQCLDIMSQFNLTDMLILALELRNSIAHITQDNHEMVMSSQFLTIAKLLAESLNTKGLIAIQNILGELTKSSKFTPVLTAKSDLTLFGTETKVVAPTEKSEPVVNHDEESSNSVATRRVNSE